MNFKLLIVFNIILSCGAFAQLKVVTTTTDLAWLAQEIGGDKVKVESLLAGTEDPHFIDATPHFVAKALRADLFCMVGLELEAAWVGKVLAKSGNRQVQKGGAGYFSGGEYISPLGVPQKKLDRSHGDVHSSGNPHYHLSPSAMMKVAQGLTQKMMDLDPKNKAHYQNNLKKTKNNLKNIRQEITLMLTPIHKKVFLEYHQEFSYFFRDYGLESIGAIEEIPGVPPSAGRISAIAKKAQSKSAYAFLVANTSPYKVTKKFQDISGVKKVSLPLSIVKGKGPSDYYEHQRLIARRMIEKK